MTRLRTKPIENRAKPPSHQVSAPRVTVGDVPPAVQPDQLRVSSQIRALSARCPRLDPAARRGCRTSRTRTRAGVRGRPRRCRSDDDGVDACPRTRLARRMRCDASRAERELESPGWCERRDGRSTGAARCRPRPRTPRTGPHTPPSRAPRAPHDAHDRDDVQGHDRASLSRAPRRPRDRVASVTEACSHRAARTSSTRAGFRSPASSVTVVGRKCPAKAGVHARYGGVHRSSRSVVLTCVRGRRGRRSPAAARPDPGSGC